MRQDRGSERSRKDELTMKIRTSIAEYGLELDHELSVGPEGVTVKALNVENGEVVELEFAAHEIATLADMLSSFYVCGICGSDLITVDDGRYNHTVGHICGKCYEEKGDHPAVRELREVSETVEALAAAEMEKES